MLYFPYPRVGTGLVTDYRLERTPEIIHPSLDRRYTFEEFLAVFDGYHAEWLPDGRVELNQMGTSAFHIFLIQWLVKILGAYFDFTHTGQVFSQSFVQRLSPELSAREPDVLIVLNEHLDRIKATYLDGAADIVMEVISPESIERDYGVKFREYEQGGVREYWLIDPERRIADVYELGENALYRRRPLDAEGRMTSGLLPKFALSPDLLWAEQKPDHIGILKLVAGLLEIDLRTLI